MSEGKITNRSDFFGTYTINVNVEVKLWQDRSGASADLDGCLIYQKNFGLYVHGEGQTHKLSHLFRQSYNLPVPAKFGFEVRKVLYK